MNSGLRSALGSGHHKTLLNTDLLKALLDLDDIIVGESVYSADGKKGVQDIWGNFTSLTVRPQIMADGNDEGQTGFAYTFRRHGMPMVDRYESAGGKVEYVRYTDTRKAAVVGGTCGYLFQHSLA
ncbi:hypothetical protein [Neisseria leonii]|uniref:hypothetical protein n=1 Tax=Neisseria leonii TaxID=2995413 RepID=UPI0030D58ACB